MVNSLKDEFLLDPSIIFLNHGSFGACPKPVFQVYQQWQLELERQPVLFLGRRIDALLRDAMIPLAEYVNADPQDMVFVRNATAGVNIVARSLRLNTGDEILTTNHEYGACTFTWEDVCQKTGAIFVQRIIDLPVTTADAFIEHFWAGVTPRTKVIYLSQITSPTALTFPIAPIIQRARAAGIITIIDGAHAPGQIPIDLQALDADFYTGNCHKWLCAPKGAAFLYARREYQDWLTPLIISWGYYEESFALRHERQGTYDPAAALSVPAAIKFQREHHWDLIRQECHNLVVKSHADFAEITGIDPIAPADWFGQMVATLLPPCDITRMKSRLYDDYQIEIPITVMQNTPFLRVSYQGYNTIEESERLKTAFSEVLALERS
jgi:isopenicillin-N epimerase